ncbi:MAG TPA: 4-hydroxythreonine-4-phosphate dehydrogenase PdxA [Casimicrobiaceae bacterium]|nr:4-hydroxythreonine-4-phosphate dehydrogenase PdxA [Casimicrobiaceae bacterium]
MPELPSIAITSGEPAGIGPELCAMLAQHHAREPYAARLVVLGDRHVLETRARRIGITPGYLDFTPSSGTRAPGGVEVWQQPVAVPVTPGSLDAANAASVIAMLGHACDACATGAFDALVTAPVQKSVLLDAGYDFSGHTEFFAGRTHTPRVVMLLVGGAGERPLRVALATTHLALRDVPGAITRALLDETIDILGKDLERRFGLADPRIAVCGLNPHAGEGGHMGREEVETITPAIIAARERGWNVDGPVPADTIFVPMHAAHYDAILAMYHDQGLPPLKAASFGQGVNVTLGLPFVRTSVDHGTALDLAALPERARAADMGSLDSALRLAIDLAHRKPR